jgi:SAM-dependent methyltransferase
LAHKPFDRAILARFAALVGEAPILDAGCGPGHVARFLSGVGANVTGLDLSAEMVAQAAALNPGIEFRRGSMLELTEEGFGGIIAFYSIIHIPRERQPAMFANWLRAMRPGGHLLLAFHVGEADRHVDELWGHPVSIDFLFFTPAEIEQRLADAGFDLVESWTRAPYPAVEAETQRAYILARAPFA